MRRLLFSILILSVILAVTPVAADAIFGPQRVTAETCNPR